MTKSYRKKKRGTKKIIKIVSIALLASTVIAPCKVEAETPEQLNAIEIYEAPPIYEPFNDEGYSLRDTMDDYIEPEVRKIYEKIEFIEGERDLLKRILWVEANNQSLEGQKAVIEVIFNRVLSNKYPNTITGVVSQKGEFASYPLRNRACVKPDSTQEQAIDEVLAETKSDKVLPSEAYIYFSRGRASYATDFIKIGDHNFGVEKQ